MGSLKVFKKVLVLITVFLVFFGCMISSFRVPVSAEEESSGGSNARVQANIQWAQKKSFQDMDTEDLSSLTYDDLRMIGVFLSNFYVPFSTGVGKSSDEETVRENMVKALINQCNFNKDVAEALVPMVWQMVLDTAQPLSIGVMEENNGVKSVRKYSKDGDKKVSLRWLIEDGKNDGDSDWYMETESEDDIASKNIGGGDNENFKPFKGTYLNFIMNWSGNIGDKGEDGIRINVSEPASSKKCLFWTDDSGQDHIVFDTAGAKYMWDTNTNNEKFDYLEDIPDNKAEYSLMAFSASSLAYGILNDNLAYNRGVGNSLFSVPDYNVLNELTEEQKQLVFVGNSRLFVDCFGDILMDNGVNQYVIVPACVNPYAWYNYEKGVSSAGESINLVNAYFIGEAESKHIYMENNNVYYKVYRGANSLFNEYYWRVYKGSTRSDIDTKVSDNDEVSKLKSYSYGAIPANRKWFSENVEFCSWNIYNTDLNDDYAKTRFTEEIPYYQNMIMLDTQGVFKKFSEAQTEDALNSVLKSVNLFQAETNNEGKTVYSTLGGFSAVNKFSSVDKDNTVTTISGSSAKQYFVSIFLSYVLAYYDTSTGTDRLLPWAYNKDAFPSASNAIDWSNVEIESDALQNELMSILYYFMHPSKGIELVKQWFKNKVSGILVGWHEDMVGAAGGVSTSGSTKYIGFSGYVTIPNLNDLAWTDWLLNQYDSLVVYFIILIMVVMLGYVMVGSLTLQRALTGVVIFAVCAYLPPKLIDTTVNISNTVCDSIYSSKFTYWALAQHYQYQNELNKAINSEDEQQYLATIFRQQAADALNDYAIVTLKWQCPKKENYSSEVKKEVNDATGNPNVFKLISGLVSSQISGESYVDTANNLYLYRSYTDVAAYSKALFENCAGSNTSFSEQIYTHDRIFGQYGVVDVGINLGYGSSVTGFGSNALIQGRYSELMTEGTYVNSFITASSSINAGNSISKDRLRHTAESNGFIFMPVKNAQDETLGIKHIVLPIVSKSVASAIIYGDTPAETLNSNTTGIDGWSISGWVEREFSGMSSGNNSAEVNFRDTLAGIPQQSYNTTLRMLNNGATCDPSTGVQRTAESTASSMSTTLDAYGLTAFACYTESPYYYLSANLSDQLELIKTDNSEYEGSSYKDLFLLPNGAYFYNMKDTTKSVAGTSYGIGEMRDFMDMRSLFNVIIPYLNAANQVVIDWDNTHGLWMYDDVDLEYGADNKILLPEEIDPDNWEFDFTDKQLLGEKLEEYRGTKEDILYKYWHNANVAQLLNMYTPWVDTMYSCSYAKPENIYVAGEKFRVEDPLDPKTYCRLDSKGNIIEGREMIFSRSEMVYYGLREDDLTQVERNIIEMYDNVYEALLPLMDYYNFGDDVLNVGAAMLETFEFNKVFSESNPFGEDYTLYPQSYELKNFSYDAFLRLILAETTGEDIASSYDEDGSMYMTIVKNSSILTGIMYILVDLLAVYAIPALKLFFLLALFALSVLVILCATIKLDISLPRVLWKSLVSPLLKFLAISIGMALAVSLFMSNGNTAVTGRGGFTISLGDPVMVLIVMLLINAIVLVLYFKTVKKVFSDCVKYAKAVGQSFTGMLGGIVAMGAAGLAAGKARVTAETVGVGGTGSATARGVSNTSRHAKSVGSGAKQVGEKAKGAGLAAVGAAAGAGALVGAGIKNATSAESQLNRYNRKIDRYKKAELKQDARENKYNKLMERSKDENLSQKQRDRAKKNADKVFNKWNKTDDKMNSSKAQLKRKRTETKTEALKKKVEVKSAKSTNKSASRIKRSSKRK